MAARRLLIVLLVLLGLSTLAAALVPQDSLRRERTASTQTSTQTTAPATTTVGGGTGLTAQIVVGGGRIPLVACKKERDKCPPVHVGDQLSLVVYTAKVPAELEIPYFGLVGVATPDSPALFDLIPDQQGTFGILFSETQKVAARIKVVAAEPPATD
jgi:hypothetical protein